MTVQTATTSGTEDIPLAQVKTFGPSEALAFLGWLASVATALFGHDFGITKNAQVLAQAAVFLIPMAQSFARSHKHRGIAQANAQVIVAQIEAATKALVAAQQQAAPGAPVPQSATTSPPSSAGGPSISYGYESTDGSVPAGKHAADDVAAGLPVVDLSSDAGHVQPDLLALLVVITTGVFLGGLVLHLVLA